VVFGGVSSDWFDTLTGEWSREGPIQFPQIAAQEHLDELLFVYNSHIFLLLYSHFGQFYPHSLHQFDTEGQSQWHKLVDFPSANRAGLFLKLFFNQKSSQKQFPRKKATKIR
jgi:hypothetical protein